MDSSFSLFSLRNSKWVLAGVDDVATPNQGPIHIKKKKKNAQEAPGTRREEKEGFSGYGRFDGDATSDATRQTEWGPMEPHTWLTYDVSSLTGGGGRRVGPSVYVAARWPPTRTMTRCLSSYFSRDVNNSRERNIRSRQSQTFFFPIIYLKKSLPGPVWALKRHVFLLSLLLFGQKSETSRAYHGLWLRSTTNL